MPGQMVPTVDGRTIPEFPDLARMRRERMARLQEQLSAQGLAGLVLLQPSAVSYASGAHFPAGDGGRAALFRPVVVVVAGDDAPHLFTPYPEGAPPDLVADHLHGPAFPDLASGASSASVLAAAVRDLVPQGRVAFDEVPHPLRALLRDRDMVPASAVMGPVKLRKTADELACIRHAQRLN